MRPFEYDKSKSIANEQKHGISFSEAQRLWADPEAVKLEAKEQNEPRYLLIAMMNGKHWSAIYTYRGLNIRIISTRRARKNEVEFYESK